MKMRVVPTKAHAAFDYAGGPVLAVAPSLLRLEPKSAAALAPRITGVGGAALSALSNHELAVRRVVPMRAHLLADAAMGAAVAALPWVTGSARRGVRYWLPHALVGTADVALAVTTRARSRSRKERLLARAGSVPRPALAAIPVGATLLAFGIAALWRKLAGAGSSEGEQAQNGEGEQAQTEE
jgi:hypothetical protein